MKAPGLHLNRGFRLMTLQLERRQLYSRGNTQDRSAHRIAPCQHRSRETVRWVANKAATAPTSNTKVDP